MALESENASEEWETLEHAKPELDPIKTISMASTQTITTVLDDSSFITVPDRTSNYSTKQTTSCFSLSCHPDASCYSSTCKFGFGIALLETVAEEIRVDDEVQDLFFVKDDEKFAPPPPAAEISLEQTKCYSYSCNPDLPCYSVSCYGSKGTMDITMTLNNVNEESVETIPARDVSLERSKCYSYACTPELPCYSVSCFSSKAALDITIKLDLIEVNRKVGDSATVVDVPLERSECYSFTCTPELPCYSVMCFSSKANLDITIKLIKATVGLLKMDIKEDVLRASGRLSWMNLVVEKHGNRLYQKKHIHHQHTSISIQVHTHITRPKDPPYVSHLTGTARKRLGGTYSHHIWTPLHPPTFQNIFPNPTTYPHIWHGIFVEIDYTINK